MGGNAMGSTTSLVARQYRLRQWANQIHECQNRPQGMTVDAWCEQNGLTKANYYYRLRQVRLACLDQMPEEVIEQIEQAVVPVSSELLGGKCSVPSADRNQSSSGIEIFCGCFRIHVTESVSPDLLANVLRVAAHVE